MPDDPMDERLQPDPEPGGQIRLQALVLEHRVCWEMYPLRDVGKEGTRTVGWCIELVGQQAPDQVVRAPGDDASRDVWANLRLIAEAAIGAATDAVRCEVLPQDPSLHYAAERKERADVTLTIEIEHATDWHRPVDASETQAAHAILARLKSLGAHDGSWPTHLGRR